MEHLEGEDLSKLKSTGIIDINKIVNIGIQICNALDFAHKRGIIHRDIKPANIIFDSNNTAKLMDFGIAQLNKEGHLRLTQEGSLLGSIMYVSPEQLINAKNVESAADIYSLGVTLYELLTGKLPFAGDNVPTLIMNILKENPEPPSKYNEKIPVLLDKIILKALEKNLGDRYQSAEEFSRDLSMFLKSENEIKNKVNVNAGSVLERKLEEELRIERERIEKKNVKICSGLKIKN